MQSRNWKASSDRGVIIPVPDLVITDYKPGSLINHIVDLAIGCFRRSMNFQFLSGTGGIGPAYGVDSASSSFAKQLAYVVDSHS